MSAELYIHARKDLGLAEVPGGRSHPRIALAIQLAASWLDRDDSKTAWCGCIRGLWGLETGTGVPAAHYRAANWLNWGVEVALKDAKRGDTVVLKRQGGFHVGLWDRIENGKVYLLGGNQSNTTSIAPFVKSLVQGVRRAA
jgi:uncharacterized protein (TIGR02594 family)